MTDEDGPTREEIIHAVEQALKELAPEADPQVVYRFIEDLWDCDWDELEVNLGAGFGQLCPDEAACNAAFARYAELMDGAEVKPNPTRPPAES